MKNTEINTSVEEIKKEETKKGEIIMKDTDRIDENKRILVRFSDQIEKDLEREFSGFAGECAEKYDDAVQQDFGVSLVYEKINDDLYYFFADVDDEHCFSSPGEKLGEVRRHDNMYFHVEHAGLAAIEIEFEKGATLADIKKKIMNTEFDISETTEAAKIFKEENPTVIFSGNVGKHKDINIIIAD